MNPKKALYVIFIVTCIELIACIALPLYILADDATALDDFITGLIFAALLIYYIVYLIALYRYIQQNHKHPKVGQWLFLNIIPIIVCIMLYFLDVLD